MRLGSREVLMLRHRIVKVILDGGIAFRVANRRITRFSLTVQMPVKGFQ